jgi:hypothetical protein
MALKHVVLRNPRLKGWEYGMLRAFEEEIIQFTGAEVIEIPHYGMDKVTSRVGHNMRWDKARKLLPKKPLPVEADVIWYILMGPENYELDLYKQWDAVAKHRIVYIFDTLQPQFAITKKLFTGDQFNICITSFNDAVPHLERLTGRKWHTIEQAVPESLFKPVEPGQKSIAFSSYGRRFPAFHEVLLSFCQGNGLYYDYTTHDGKHPTAPEYELYKQYAWHLGHSMFTVSWPVELTNPARAGILHPITCRWFEAAATGTVIIGQKPGNPLFDEMLYPGLVLLVDPFQEKKALWKNLEKIYADRISSMTQARQVAEANQGRWTWKNRVQRIAALINAG